jgi:uncharacterized membrane protein
VRARLLPLAALLCLLVFVGPAGAQEESFDLPRADVAAEVQPDGSLMVTEEITYDYTGSFSGGYREIPLREGESVSEVSVSEGGREYSPGASAELGSSGAPDTFGTADLGDAYRIVWHYQAADEQRTFTVRYRLSGLAVAYDDVVDVYLQAWGDEWEVSLDELNASLAVPDGARRGEVRVFGHPSSVSGLTSLGEDGVSLRLTASDIPAGQFVEMRVVFPRELLDSTGGASVRSGAGLQGILEEEAAEARRVEEERRNSRALLRLLPLLALLSFVPALSFAAFLYPRYGRERRVDYDREYEQEPPTDDAPAAVGVLMGQRNNVGVREFTATMFDLIRRGALTAEPVTVERKTWAGLRTEVISDLQIGMGKRIEMNAYESSVMTVVRRVLKEGPQPLTEFRERIRKDATGNAKTYQVFQDRVRKAVEKLGFFERGAGTWVGIGIGAAILALVAGVIGAVMAFGSGSLLWGGFCVILAIAAFCNLLVLVVFAFLRPVWVRRTKKGALLHARWSAFRSYLEDFSRMEEAPPASLVLWESYLVYGIVLGVAEHVLNAARLHAPPDLQESRLYWYGSDGVSMGHTANTILGLESSLSGAFSPPSSSSSGGFGGGFSGRGGGGGGGGAW